MEGYNLIRRYDGIGRHSRLKICQERFCTGSSPVSGTIFGYPPGLFRQSRRIILGFQERHDCCCGSNLLILVHVRVDICRGCEGAVA